jgi:hypothetical protein
MHPFNYLKPEFRESRLTKKKYKIYRFLITEIDSLGLADGSVQKWMLGSTFM